MKPREFWIKKYDDENNFTVVDSTAHPMGLIHTREVLPNDSCQKCEERKNIHAENVKIDWVEVWNQTEDWLLTFDDSMSERQKIQRLVEKQLKGE